MSGSFEPGVAFFLLQNDTRNKQEIGAKMIKYNVFEVVNKKNLPRGTRLFDSNI